MGHIAPQLDPVSGRTIQFKIQCRCPTPWRRAKSLYVRTIVFRCITNRIRMCTFEQQVLLLWCPSTLPNSCLLMFFLPNCLIPGLWPAILVQMHQEDTLRNHDKSMFPRLTIDTIFKNYSKAGLLNSSLEQPKHMCSLSFDTWLEPSSFGEERRKDTEL